MVAGLKKGDVVAVIEHPDYIHLQQDYLDSDSQIDFFRT